MPPLRKLLFGLIFLIAVAATLGVLVYSFVDYRGRATWDRTKKELLAKGEPLSLTEQIPPDVPPDQNFYATANWTNIFNSDKTEPFDVLKFQDESLWKKIGHTTAFFTSWGEPSTWDLDSQAKAYHEKGLAPGNEKNSALVVLDVLSRAGALSSDIEESAKRRYAKAPIAYSKKFEAPARHLAQILALSKYFGNRAIARMATGDPHGAATDIQLIFKLCNAVSSDPFLISKLVGNSAASIAIFSFWNCNSRGTFSESDLASIQSCFQDFSALRNVAAGYRGERGVLNEWLAENPSSKELSRLINLLGQSSRPGERFAQFSWLALTFYPRGYFLDTQSEFNLAIQRVIDTLLQGKIGDLPGLSMLEESGSDVKHTLLRIAVFSADSTAVAAFELQNQLDLATTACALERYRLKHGSFPDSLNALVPDFLPKPPVDLLSGATLGYQIKTADNYELTSPSAKSPGDQTRPKDGLLRWMRLPPR